MALPATSRACLSSSCPGNLPPWLPTTATVTAAGQPRNHAPKTPAPASLLGRVARAAHAAVSTTWPSQAVATAKPKPPAEVPASLPGPCSQEKQKTKKRVQPGGHSHYNRPPAKQLLQPSQRRLPVEVTAGAVQPGTAATASRTAATQPWQNCQVQINKRLTAAKKGPTVSPHAAALLA